METERTPSTRAILDSSTEFAIILTDTRGRITIWNEGAHRIMGWTSEEMVGQGLHRIFTPEDVAAGVPEREMGLALEGGRSPDERWHARKDGSRFWASGILNPLKGDTGEVLGFVKIVRDLTERREAEERRKLLVSELQHRIKNTLAMVHSIALQTMRGDTDIDHARTAFTARLMALANAHDVLTEVSWTAAPIRDIIQRVLLPHVSPDSERIDLSGPLEVRLGARTALALSLTLNELITNAVKYGAFSNDAGRISIDWHVVTDSTGEHLKLRWRERGGPPVSAPAKKGFGSRLIEAGFGSSGSSTLTYEPDGVVCEIETTLG
jgi:PAS domain S-box-containing protein